MDIYFLTLAYYYANHWIPLNSIPLWGDAVLGVIVPRVLVLIYIYQNIGLNNVWFWLHLVVFFFFAGGTGAQANSRRSE